MAFDFNGGKKSGGWTGKPRSDIDYTSLNSVPRPSAGSNKVDPPSSSTGFSGFSNGSPDFQNQPNSSQNRPSGFSDKPSGFQNRPENRSGSTGGNTLRPTGNTPVKTPRRMSAKRPVVRGGRDNSDIFSVPWNIVLSVMGIIIIVALCVVFREEITEFLVQVLTWVIIILVIIVLLKWFIFGKKRK